VIVRCRCRCRPPGIADLRHDLTRFALLLGAGNYKKLLGFDGVRPIVATLDGHPRTNRNRSRLGG
jgi:hypothetical protein